MNNITYVNHYIIIVPVCDYYFLYCAFSQYFYLSDCQVWINFLLNKPFKQSFVLFFTDFLLFEYISLNFSNFSNLSPLKFFNRNYTESGRILKLFFIIFVIAKLVFSFIINSLNYTLKFPILRMYDSTVGGFFGFLTGIFVTYAVFILTPLILAIQPIQEIYDIVYDSLFASFFYTSNFILNFIRGVI